jgi:hypothetical protein
MARRDPAGVWTPVDTSTFPPDVFGVTDCERGEQLTVLVTSSQNRPAVFVTADGATFERVAVTEEVTSSINAITTLDGRWYGIGAVSEHGDADGALWNSPDGRRWERVEVAGLDGPSDQVPADVVAHHGSLVIVAIDRGAPVTWTVTPPG